MMALLTHHRETAFRPFCFHQSTVLNNILLFPILPSTLASMHPECVTSLGDRRLAGQWEGREGIGKDLIAMRSTLAPEV